MEPLRIGTGLLFYPRGSSAFTARSVVHAMLHAGHQVTLFAGSLGRGGEDTHAGTFFTGLDLRALDYTPAADAARRGHDPLGFEVPLHPSYEDRPGAPDRIFTSVAPALAERHVAAWSRMFSGPSASAAEIFHLHHLTPQHEALARVRPDIPVVTELHGSELAMAAGIAARQRIAQRQGTDLAGMADAAENGQLDPAAVPGDDRGMFDATRWEMWRHGDWWLDRMRRWAARSAVVIVHSEPAADLATSLLGLERSGIEIVPHGVDTEVFAPATLEPTEARNRWQRWLVDEPRGWDASGEPGSIRYQESDLRWFVDPGSGFANPVLIYFGIFAESKRLPVLVRAHHLARPRFDVDAPLVIWGGQPGEWEGEHPASVARELSAQGVFFTGWRATDEVPAGLECADVMVSAAVNEMLGHVFLEAMAAGLPVIATHTGDAPMLVNTQPGEENGWLVRPDDEVSLADAMVAAVNDEPERQRRSRNAVATVESRYAWPAVAQQVVSIYRSVLG